MDWTPQEAKAYEDMRRAERRALSADTTYRAAKMAHDTAYKNLQSATDICEASEEERITYRTEWLRTIGREA